LFAFGLLLGFGITLQSRLWLECCLSGLQGNHREMMMEVINVCFGMALGLLSVAINLYIVYKFIRHIFFFNPL
jgi:hypothetical protein